VTGHGTSELEAPDLSRPCHTVDGIVRDVTDTDHSEDVLMLSSFRARRDRPLFITMAVLALGVAMVAAVAHSTPTAKHGSVRITIKLAQSGGSAGTTGGAGGPTTTLPSGVSSRPACR
jgi:hypothetical protein